MPSQESEHAPRLEQMPGDRLNIEKITLNVRSSLHPKIISN